MAEGAVRREDPQVDDQEYPDHLHVNIVAAMRGQGLWRRLMEAYLDSD